LQELEFAGYLEKIGVQGRILTERGLGALEDSHAEAMLRSSGDALLNTLNRGDRQHLYDLLAARLVIEGATAALAAERATPETIARLEGLIEGQATRVERGEAGIEQDVSFHAEIARASGNEVLHSLVRLLRQHHRYNVAMTSIRREVGSRLVVDHAAILKAIKTKNPPAARKAMERHLSKLADDLRDFWPDEANQHIVGDGPRNEPGEGSSSGNVQRRTMP